MSDKNTKILIIASAVALLLSGLVLYKVFDMQGYSEHKTSGYVNYKVNDYIEVTPVVFNKYNDFYSSVNVSRVNIKNINNNDIEDFIKMEDEIIGYIDAYYNEIDVTSGYVPVSTVSSIVKTQINETVLSIYYEMNFDLDKNIFDNSKKTYIVTVNIDLGTEKILSNDEILSKYNYSKEYISEKIFEEDVLLSEGEIAIDKNTNISLTKKDIERKKEEYVERIVNEFDNIIKVYIENNSLAIVYDKRELNSNFFENEIDTEIKIRYLK